ncbi:MAG: DUF2723 domain-containing protein [Myxococcales bacterium]|nr:DUF2723 domain-containing protein [Myxococcales bacterium]
MPPRAPENTLSLSRGRWLTALATALALAARRATAVEAPVDVDTVNFGLSAFRFDLVSHQPHPPGYLGYVLFLKLLHALLGRLGPVEVAVLGSLLCGVLCVPLAWWAVGRVAALRGDAVGLRVGAGVSAALLAGAHPLLWYSSCDGQSHAAEALAVFALVGLAAELRRRSGVGWALAMGVAVGLAGALRPTVWLVAAPLGAWALGPATRRARAWALAGGALSTLGWYLPLVRWAGGFALYARVSRALVQDIFIANYSVLNLFRAPERVLGNVTMATLALALALLPLLAGRRFASPVMRRGLALAGLSWAFYAAVYTAEAGYFSAVAALGCLAPLGWSTAGRREGLGVAAAALVGIGVFLAGPAQRALGAAGEVWLPTRATLVAREASAERLVEAVCRPLRGRAALVLTDAPETRLLRYLPLRCPGVTAAWLGFHPVVKPSLEQWQVFSPWSMRSFPSEVPYEIGEARAETLDAAVQWVVLAPSASAAMRDALLRQARCPARRPGGTPALFWSSACLPEIRLSPSALRLTPSAR